MYRSQNKDPAASSDAKKKNNKAAVFNTSYRIMPQSSNAHGATTKKKKNPSVDKMYHKRIAQNAELGFELFTSTIAKTLRQNR